MKSTAAVLVLTLSIAGTAGAQHAPAGVRFSVPSFIFARWATRSASSLYAGYSAGPLGGFVGLVENPRTGYRELLGGVVTRAGYRDQAVTLGLAYADATESRYLQTYVVPSLQVAGASIGGTLELYVPLDEAGTHQLDVNPIAVMLHPVSWLGVGGAYAAGVAEGDRPHHRAGPTVEIGVPRGSIKGEFLRNFALGYYEARISFEAAF
jgi:hypothetical protein